MNFEKEIAQKLLQIKAIKLSPQNPFTWASGMRSPIYCDNRVTLSYPAIRKEIVHGFVKLSESFEKFDQVCGVATAGIAHGVLLAEQLGLPFSYVRSAAKSHGRQNQIEGEIAPNSRILVIEDLISTGGSSMQAVDVLRNAGHTVVGVAAIFTYQFTLATKLFADNDCPMATISNYEAMLNEAKELDYISPTEEKTLISWSADPKIWFEKNY